MDAPWPPGLTDPDYLRLTTYRKDGRPVTTPVWAAAGDGALWAFTGRDAGKAKRLRHTQRVLVGACDVRGRGDGPEVEAVVTLHTGPGAVAARDRVARRHRIAYPLWAVYFRLRHREEYDHPVGLEIRPASA